MKYHSVTVENIRRTETRTNEIFKYGEEGQNCGCLD